MDRMTRRNFLAASAALPAFLGTPSWGAGKADITVGITVDTRPDWNGPANFIRSIDEVSEVGYHWIETFWPYVARWEKNPQGLKDELDKLGATLNAGSDLGQLRSCRDFSLPKRRVKLATTFSPRVFLGKRATFKPTGNSVV